MSSDRHFTKDFIDARQDFNLFLDEITKYFPKSEIIITEDCVNKKNLDILDSYCGIDAIMKIPNGFRGLAVRVQWSKAYDTFTIRYLRINSKEETEYQKRLKSIKVDGCIYPYITIQAYLEQKNNPKSILSLGIVKTKSLYEFVKNRVCHDDIMEWYYSADRKTKISFAGFDVGVSSDNKGDVIFLAIPFKELLLSLGNDFIWEKNKEQIKNLAIQNILT